MWIYAIMYNFVKLKFLEKNKICQIKQKSILKIRVTSKFLFKFTKKLDN